MGDRGNRADDAEGSVFDDGETVVAAVAFRFEELDTGSLFAERFQFGDLVFQPTDLGFVHLHRSEFDRVVDRNAADVIDDSATVFDGPISQFFKRGPCGANCIIDIEKESIAAVCR